MQDTKSAWTMKERGMKNEEPATQCEKETMIELFAENWEVID